MKTKEKKLSKLSELEMQHLNGGSLIFELGRGLHKGWCTTKTFWKDYSNNPHSAYGVYAGMR
jgi:hypothetical protein